MDREKVKKLFKKLKEDQFSFIESGTHHIDEIYRKVKNEYPDLCNDNYICKEHCKNGQNQPEWKHQVRWVLLTLKNNYDSRVRSNEKRKYWDFGEFEIKNSHTKFSKEKENTFMKYAANIDKEICAVCGISEKEFLVQLTLPPWTGDRRIDFDSSHKIWLCCFHDIAVKFNYLIIDKNYRIRINKKLRNDSKLHAQLNPFEGMMLVILPDELDG